MKNYDLMINLYRFYNQSCKIERTHCLTDIKIAHRGYCLNCGCFCYLNILPRINLPQVNGVLKVLCSKIQLCTKCPKNSNNLK